MKIVMGGGSCSGKSTIATQLAKSLNSPIIHLDSFFRRDDPTGPKITINGQVLFDCNHPETVNLGLAIKEIEKYQATLVIEGHFALTYPELREISNLTIFVECSPELRHKRRINRELNNQKGTLKEITDYYEQCAVPGFANYIAPSAQYADISIDGALEPSLNVVKILDYLKSISNK